MSVSVFIQTLNEEANLPRCLKSVSWSDDVVVLDSLSTDRTEEIAQTVGARFYQRPFDGRANNQNWAVENIQFKHPWVYHIDADEVVPPELAAEILEVTSDLERDEVCYRLRFKNMFMGRWLKHSSLYPSWFPRLFRPERIRWQRAANPVAMVDGPEGKLRSHFVHYAVSKGLAAWFERHNRYSSYEAVETIKHLQNGRVDWRGLFSTDPVRRRRALKEVSFRLPLRPCVKFFYMYFLRRGFWDGFPGLTYCTLQAIYEYMISLKVKELRRRSRGLPM